MPFRKSQYRLPREEGTSPHSQLSFSLSLTLYFCFLLVQFLCTCVPVQSCLTLCDPMDCSPPDSSVHGISQARMLEWFTMPSSRGSSQPRDPTCISCASCVAGGFFISEPPGKKFHLTSPLTPNSSLVSPASGFSHWKLPMRGHQFVGSVSRHPCWPQL